MNALAPISDKLAKFMRLLSSDSGGEVIAAVQALHHILQSADADIHAPASMVEKPTNDGVSQHRMAIYCQENMHKLAAKHHQFIDDMASRTPYRDLIEAQGRYLTSLFHRCGGGHP
jgi:hypothetical protein